MPALIDWPRRQLRRGFTPAMLTLFSVVGIAGCALQSTPDAAGVMLDRSQPEARRVRVVQNRPLAGPDHAETLAALHVLVWSDLHPLAVRVAAMDRLIGHDADRFWRWADRWLVAVDDLAMVAAIGERAVRGQRRDAIPALLRRWARPQVNLADDKRPECDAFMQLVAPRPMAEALWDRVAAQTHTGWPETQTQTAAWTVLSRLEDEAWLREKLAATEVSHGRLGDLRAAAEVLDHLPHDAEGLRWLAALRRDGDLWDAATDARTALPVEGWGPLECRHLPMLARLPLPQQRWSGPRFRAALQVALRDTRHVGRELPAGVQIRDGDTWSASAAASLAWADWAVAWSVTQAMRDQSVVAAWFAQADADLADTTTEHGGVLTWAADGAWWALPFAPVQREGDRKFFSSPALVEAMYTGLAHYHFHAQAYDSAEYAGPGRGDLAFTDAMSAHTLTLTFLDRDRLNIDLAFPGGRVLDLGCVTRPGAPAAVNR